MRALIFWLCVILLLIVVSNLTGCYSASKAKAQFSRAAVAYPELPADYCARVYPAKDSLIKGDSVITFDTIYTGGDVVFDTVILNDTVRITKVIQLPGKVITERIIRTDTVRVVNTAALDLANINLTRSLALADEKTKEADKWRKIAKKRFWIILGMGAGIALGIFVALRKKIIKQVK